MAKSCKGCPAENCLRYESEKKSKKSSKKENIGMNENYIEIPDSVDEAVLGRIKELEELLTMHDKESQRISSQINELLKFHNDYMRCDAG